MNIRFIVALSLLLCCSYAQIYECSLNCTSGACDWTDASSWSQCNGNYPSNANYNVIIDVDTATTLNVTSSTASLGNLTISGTAMITIVLYQSTISFTNASFTGSASIQDSSSSSIFNISSAVFDLSNQDPVNFDIFSTIESTTVKAGNVTFEDTSMFTDMDVASGASVSLFKPSSSQITNYGNLIILFPFTNNTAAVASINLKNYGYAILSIPSPIIGSIWTSGNASVLDLQQPTLFNSTNSVTSQFYCNGVVNSASINFTSAIMIGDYGCTIQSQYLSFDDNSNLTAIGGTINSDIIVHQSKFTDVLINGDINVSGESIISGGLNLGPGSDIIVAPISVTYASLQLQEAIIYGSNSSVLMNNGFLSGSGALHINVSNTGVITHPRLIIDTLYLYNSSVLQFDVEAAYDNETSEYISVLYTSVLDGEIQFNLTSSVSEAQPNIFYQQTGTTSGDFNSVTFTGDSMPQDCDVETDLSTNQTSSSPVDTGYIYHVGVSSSCFSSSNRGWAVVGVISAIAVVVPLIITAILMFIGLRKPATGYQTIKFSE